MNYGCPLPALQILQRPPDVLQPALIEKVQVAVRQTCVDEGGSRIDEELKIRGRPGAIGVLGGGSHGLHYILVRAAFVSIRIENWSLFSWSWGNFISGVSIRFWKMETRGWMLEEDTDQVGPINHFRKFLKSGNTGNLQPVYDKRDELQRYGIQHKHDRCHVRASSTEPNSRGDGG